MSFIADVLLAAGALGVGFYCHVLSRRLKRFTDLEKGVGGAVAVLSAQVDDLNRTVVSAKDSASESVATLTNVTERAEKSARHLELLVASLHDLPSERPGPVAQASAGSAVNPFFVSRSRIAEQQK